MTKLLIISDLHLEVGDASFRIPTMENEKEIIVILAGDIGIVKKTYTFNDFITDVSDRFKTVIWILGNHEHWDGNFPQTYPKLKLHVETNLWLENVYVAEKETEIIGDIAFVCATMWSNFDNCDALAMWDAEMWMNDYKYTRTGQMTSPWQRKLKPKDTLADYLKAKDFIFPEIARQKADGKTVVVVTHHAPSRLSIPPKFKNDDVSGAYASELFEDIMDAQPTAWIHGHIHHCNDYLIGNTRVVSNTHGYACQEYPELIPEFNPILTIEV